MNTNTTPNLLQFLLQEEIFDYLHKSLVHEMKSFKLVYLCYFKLTREV